MSWTVEYKSPFLIKDVPLDGNEAICIFLKTVFEWNRMSDEDPLLDMHIAQNLWERIVTENKWLESCKFKIKEVDFLSRVAQMISWVGAGQQHKTYLKILENWIPTTFQKKRIIFYSQGFLLGFRFKEKEYQSVYMKYDCWDAASLVQVNKRKLLGSRVTKALTLSAFGGARKNQPCLGRPNSSTVANEPSVMPSSGGHSITTTDNRVLQSHSGNVVAEQNNRVGGNNYYGRVYTALPVQNRGHQPPSIEHNRGYQPSQHHEQYQSALLGRDREYQPIEHYGEYQPPPIGQHRVYQPASNEQYRVDEPSLIGPYRDYQ